MKLHQFLKFRKLPKRIQQIISLSINSCSRISMECLSEHFDGFVMLV